MRNMLALIGLAVVVFFGVGYVRGWYAFSFTTGSDGKTDVHVNVDTIRVKNDASLGATKVEQAIESLKTKEPAAGSTPPPSTPGASLTVPQVPTPGNK